MKQFTALLCLTLLSLSSAVSPPAPAPPTAPVVSANCNTTEFQAGLILEEINKDRGDGYIFSLFRVADAHSQQAGAGTIFYFTIDVLETDCPVISRKSWKDCKVKPFNQAVFGQCKASMYLSLPWRRVKLYNYNCTFSTVPHLRIISVCPDCPTVATDVTPFVEKAERLVAEFNKKGSQAHYFKLDKVERASTSWMGGPAAFVDFSIKETNCPSSTATPADCQFLEKAKAHLGFCKGSLTNPPGAEGELVSASCDIYDPRPADPSHETKKEGCDHGEAQQNCQVKSGEEAVTHTCKVKAYQKPGEKTFTIESLNCDLPPAGEPEILILPIMCPGCPEDISGNSNEVQTILKQAVAQYNKDGNQKNIYKVGEILKATSQVVAGWIYTIQFKIQETNCLKSDVAHQHHGCINGKGEEHHAKDPCAADLSKCHVKTGEGAVTHTCKVKAYQKPGEKTFTIESLNCDLPPAGEPEILNLPIMCPGCPERISGNSNEVQTILKQAVAQYNKDGNQKNIYKVGEILKATSQVVAGWIYTIQFKIQETNCLKSDVAHQHHGCINGKGEEHHAKDPCAADLSKCHVKTGEGAKHTCRVEYWTQPWLNKAEILSLNCSLPAGGSPAQHFPQNCRGCPAPMPSNSEKLKPILNQALQKYNKESNAAHLFKLGQIIKATTQVVSGTKYTVEFTIEETDCTMADLPPISADCKKDGGDHHHHHEHEVCAKDINWQRCHHSHVEGEETVRCKAEITTRPWEKNTDITLNCSITIASEPLILLLPCPGCPYHISADSEELRPFLKQIIQKYNRESNKDHLYKMGQLSSAKKQVVAGFKYFIEFTIEETNCSTVDFPTISTDCKTHEHHEHHGHDHGHSHEHGQGHQHGHSHGHGHHHHHGSGHHDGSSEEQTGLKPVAPAQAGHVGSVHYIYLVHLTDVLPAPSIPGPSHPVVPHDSPPVPHGPLPVDPFTDPEPMPFPTTPSTSPSCPGKPKQEQPLILPLFPVPK